MKVLLKNVGEEPKVVDIESSLESMQGVVDGYIEAVYGTILKRNYAVVCNEEGRIKDLPYNCSFEGIDYVGNIFFAGVKDNDFCDIPDILVTVIEDMIE